MDILQSNILLNQLKLKGIDPEEIKEQILRFKKGYKPANITKPCTIGDGIRKLSSDELSEYIYKYDNKVNEIDICKFVPASGAATRMFKDLLNLQNSLNNNLSELDEKVNNTLEEFVSNIDKFAFKDDLEKVLGHSVSDIISKNVRALLNALLDEEGLNYKNLPKGLIKFHRYNGESRTAFEEHFIEGLEHVNSKNKVSMHFTIQEEFQTDFKNELDYITEKLSSTGVEFDVSFSVQNPATDTIAVDLENNPVLTESGELVFRPAGHGALIRNLNSLNHDYIFIKNIDNVTIESLLFDTVNYKKALGGILFYLQEKIFGYLYDISESNLAEIISFCEKKLSMSFSKDFYKSDFESRKKYLTEILNRPIRVVGVVKNAGEPGGGPFWVEGSRGIESMQIVESAQVDMSSVTQSEIWNSSTHFNPVDIVCGLKDYKGNKFNLNDFIDYEAGIITRKSFEGKEIKALELPGLWNGSMSDWITLFVEVPLSTFNPVKTVFDLLRKEHQTV
ncbi:MAG: DUF4301 family protein [Thermodesulfobacteriota bacterium]